MSHDATTSSTLPPALHDLRAQLGDELGRTDAAVRPSNLVRRGAFGVLLLAIVAIFMLALAFGWRPTMVHPVAGTSALIQMLAALTLFALTMREAIPGQRSHPLALLLGALCALTTHLGGGMLPMLPRIDAPATAKGIVCYSIEFGLAIPIIALLLALVHRSLVPSPLRFGLAGGLAVGVASDAIWRLVCPYNDLHHVLTAHSTAVLSITFAALAIVTLRDWLRR
ncbi:MAG: NrsF family protein [Acidobacteriota bacterium]